MATVEPNLARSIAGMVGVRKAVLEEAHKIGRTAAALLTAHRDTGDAKIEVESAGFFDATVSLVDEAAGAIEYGRPPNAAGKGRMEGLRVLTRAAQL